MLLIFVPSTSAYAAWLCSSSRYFVFHLFQDDLRNVKARPHVSAFSSAFMLGDAMRQSSNKMFVSRTISIWHQAGTTYSTACPVQCRPSTAFTAFWGVGNGSGVAFFFGNVQTAPDLPSSAA